MDANKTSPVVKILTLIALLAIFVAQVGVAVAQTGGTNYPLAGQTYEGCAWNVAGSDDCVRDEGYDVRWEAIGRLWQWRLPPGPEREPSANAFTIEEGTYVFNGVACRFYLDEERNGKGSGNPETVSYGNDLSFTVDTEDGGQAWAMVECDGGSSSGFDIWLVELTNQASPAETQVAPATPTARSTERAQPDEPNPTPTDPGSKEPTTFQRVWNVVVSVFNTLMGFVPWLFGMVLCILPFAVLGLVIWFIFGQKKSSR